MTDYAQESQNIWNKEQEELELTAQEEEKALDEFLSDDHLIAELIDDYDCYPELGEALRAYDKGSPFVMEAIRFLNKMLESAKHRVEK